MIDVDGASQAIDSGSDLDGSPPFLLPSPFAWTRGRIFLTYGRTNDLFCLPSGLQVRYERMMHDHLRRHEYRVIVFFGNRGCYFLEQTDRDAVIDPKPEGRPVEPDSGPTAGSGLLEHSTGFTVLHRHQVQAPPRVARALRYADMAVPAVMVPLVRRLLCDSSRSTAVIFANDDIFSTFARSELNQQFQAFVKNDVPALPVENRNVLIFNFPGHDPWETLAGHRWNFLLGSTRGTGGIARPVFIGLPEADEVEHSLMSLHLKGHLSLEAAQFEQSTRQLTGFMKSEDLGLSFLGEIVKRKRLDVAVTDDITRRTSGSHRPARDRLQELTGLGEVKVYVKRKLEVVRHQRENNPSRPAPRRQDLARLVPEPPPRWVKSMQLHLVLTGNPGTGKTTIARLLGEIYREAGVLSLGHTVTVTRADLVAGYVGQTAGRVRDAVQRAVGGVLFIDEAYDLCRGEDDDFGQEAVNTLVESLSSRNGELAVILAGYPADMTRLLETNDGLKSRFGDVLHISDYGPAELEEILRDSLKDRPGLELADSLDERLADLVSAIHAGRDRRFGNARDMIKLADAIHEACVHRNSMTADPDSLPGPYRKLLDRPSVNAEGILDDLDSLVGLESVKSRIRTLVNRLKLDRLRGTSGDGAPLAHLLFTGRPGTGKTTVAGILARQLVALGMLANPEPHVATASHLIRGFVGQTEQAMQEFLAAGLGRLIFIDEAHQLAPGPSETASFGKEALNALVPFAENHRQECLIVLAGYPDEMRRLLALDPGLSSRFPVEISFEDYSPAQMVEIFDRMLLGRGISWPRTDLEAGMSRYFHDLREAEGNGFGNARSVRNLIEECMNSLADRLAEQGARMGGQAEIDVNRLTLEDLPVRKEELSMTDRLVAPGRGAPR